MDANGRGWGRRRPTLAHKIQQGICRRLPPARLSRWQLATGSLPLFADWRNGAGKTAITLRLAASVALGIVFASRETKKRRVLYLAAENAADVRMRWAQQMDFDADAIEVFFVEGAFKISQMAETLKAEAVRCGGEFGLVIIDTGPVFYEGDYDNNRTQQARHGVMLLIDTIPGKPGVIVNVHPVKNPGADDLLPAGGGTSNPDRCLRLDQRGSKRGNR
jgi:AAA domain-containing protein